MAIVNFTATGAAHDVIRFDDNLFANWAQVQAATSQHGADTYITLDSHDVLIIKNVDMHTLSAADFLFY